MGSVSPRRRSASPGSCSSTRPKTTTIPKARGGGTSALISCGSRRSRSSRAAVTRQVEPCTAAVATAVFERVVEGFEARIVQHEFDHLNGVLFLDRMRDLASLAFLDEWQEYMQDPAESDRPAAADKAE